MTFEDLYKKLVDIYGQNNVTILCNKNLIKIIKGNYNINIWKDDDLELEFSVDESVSNVAGYHSFEQIFEFVESLM